MQQLNVVLLEAAISDIVNVTTFVADQSQSLEVALAFSERIERRCREIGKVPYIGVARPDFGDGIRLVPFERSAVILYRVAEDAVEIVRVFYGGQDYDTIMGSQG